MIDSLRDFQSRLLLAIHGIPETELRRPESDGRWSIAQVIAHLSQFELVIAIRFRSILAEEVPALLPFDQNRWMAGVHGRETLAENLEQFWFHRRMNLALYERLTAEERQRAGIHPIHGRLTIDELFTRLSAHSEKHLGQIEKIKQSLGLAVSDQPDVSSVVGGTPGETRSPGEGVRIRELWSDGTRRALEVLFDPGAQWPGLDYHVPGPEEVYVIRGDFDDGANVYREGAFLHHPAGSSHSPRSEGGCALLVYYPEG